MDEAGARDWLANEFDVSRETFERLDAFVELLRAEARHQNLISAATFDQIWARHIVDSAQLLELAAGKTGPWIDLGSGAGFPGLIVGLLRPGPTILVEARPKRAAFLDQATKLLGVGNRVTVLGSRVEKVAGIVGEVISARAFAPLDKLFSLGLHLATARTQWILPKGRGAKTELDAAASSWQGDFRLERSITDPDAWIICARNVRRRARGNDRHGAHRGGQSKGRRR